MDNEDVKWFWAAYRKNGLEDFKSPEVFPEGLQPDDFRNRLLSLILELADTGHIFIAKTPGGEMPVGAVFGQVMERMLIVGQMIWFPWATPRNRLESVVNWVNEMRVGVKVLEFAEPKDKDFWVAVAKHGIMRRVGTVHDFYEEPSPMFESIMK